MSKSTIAAIDVGSNTVHLIVVRPDREPWKYLANESVLLKLGMQVEQTGALSVAAVSGLRKTLREFVAVARKQSAQSILIGATAAMRQARNGSHVLAELSQDLDLPVRLLSETREAELGLLAVQSELRASGEQVFIDSGGGSTEVTLCNGKKVKRRVCLSIGAAKLSQHLKLDPPSPITFAELMVPISLALTDAPRAHHIRAALFSGGSAHHLCDIAEVDRTILHRAHLDKALRTLLRKKAKKVAKRADIPVERVPLCIAGALILGAIMDHYNLSQATVTTRTIREGMVMAYLKNPHQWWKG